MMFHVGQKVVCVDDRWNTTRWFFELETNPTKGFVYTVRALVEWEGHPGVLLEEIINPLLPYHGGIGEKQFAARRFRPVVTTDISIFEAMLVPTPKEKVLVGADDPGIERRR